MVRAHALSATKITLKNSVRNLLMENPLKASLLHLVPNFILLVGNELALTIPYGGKNIAPTATLPALSIPPPNPPGENLTAATTTILTALGKKVWPATLRLTRVGKRKSNALGTARTILKTINSHLLDSHLVNACSQPSAPPLWRKPCHWDMANTRLWATTAVTHPWLIALG